MDPDDTGRPRSVRALTAGVVDGRAVATAVSFNQIAHTRDVLTGELLDRFVIPKGCDDLEHVEVDGRSSLVVDGIGVVDGLFQRTVWRMDLVTGVPIDTPPGRHQPAGAGLATAVLNGRAIAISGSPDGKLQAWDLLGQQPLGPTFDKHTDHVNNVATAMLDGRLVAVTGDLGRVVRVWDPVEGREMREPLQLAARHLHHLTTFTLDGRPSVITDGTDEGLEIHDLDSRQLVRQLLPGTTLAYGRHAVAVTELAGRPIVVVGGWHGCVYVLDPVTGDPLCDPLLTGTTMPGLVAVVDAGTGPVVVVAGHNSATVRAWDLAAACGGREAVGPRVLPGTLTAVSVDESKGGSSVVTGHADKGRLSYSGHGTGYVCVTDLADGTPVRSPVEVRGEGAMRLGLTHIDGEAVAVVNAEDTPRLLRLSDVTPIATSFTTISLHRSHEGPISAVATSYLHDRPIAVTGGRFNGGRVWYLDDGELCGATKGRGDFDTCVTAMAIGVLRGRPVAVTAGPRLADRLHVWWASSGRPVCRPETGHSGDVNAIALVDLDDIAVAVTAGDDCLVCVWSLATGKPVRAALAGHTAPVRAAATLRGVGRAVVATGGDDRTVRLWDLDRERQLGRFDLPEAVTTLASTSDGRLVVGFGQDLAVFTPRIDGEH
ncbi:WD40 repeat domain-containing protein [Embleya sp. NPDC001921]